MAPNFNINSIALHQCSPADLELITPVALNVKSASTPTPAAPVAHRTVDSESVENYWNDDSECYFDGATVVKMEARMAALARVISRVEARRAASIQPREFSVGAVEQSLSQEAERRAILKSTSSCDRYWNSCDHSIESGLVSNLPASKYWVEISSHRDGLTAEDFDQRKNAMKRMSELVRFRARAVDNRSSCSIERSFVSQDPYRAVTADSCWAC